MYFFKMNFRYLNTSGQKTRVILLAIFIVHLGLKKDHIYFTNSPSDTVYKGHLLPVHKAIFKNFVASTIWLSKLHH